MRVGFDCAPLLDPPTGVGRYVRELAHSLEGLGVNVERYAVAFGGRAGPGVRRYKVPARVAQALWRRTGRPGLDRFLGGVDLVHATNFVLPALSAVPGVVTVHDLSYLRDDAFPGSRRLRDLVPWSVRRAAAVVVPTEAIRSEVVQRLGAPEQSVHVTPEGVHASFFGATPLADTVLGRLGIPGRFALAVGAIEPRKNLPGLLQAWRLAADALQEWTLVIAGPRGWGPQLEHTDGVVLLGRVGDETLPGLFAAADFFCYPSLYEGFGLPPLEAMAAGTPVLAGNYPAASEVLGDSALVVEATDPEALAAALRRLATDSSERRRLAMAGRARAATFTWERTALATRRAYEAALG